MWGTATYREPLATGTNSLPLPNCGEGMTSGVAIVRWTKAGTTVLRYDTTDVGVGVGLQGTVVSGVDLKLVNGSARPRGTAPTTYRERTTHKAYPTGDGAVGTLVFSTDDPASWAADGLTRAAVEGEVGTGPPE